jgi:hypothetical protein
MVIAGLGQGLAMALWFGSWAVLAYVLTGGALWQLLVRPAEERDLHATFGDGFTRYCAHVACWVPRARPYAGIRETQSPAGGRRANQAVPAESWPTPPPAAGSTGRTPEHS